MCMPSIALRVESKYFACEAFLPEDVRCSDDTTGELLCPLEILRRVPGLASVVFRRERSPSPLITASRLLETAGRLDDPLDRKKLALDNCMNPRTQEVLRKKTRTKIQYH